MPPGMAAFDAGRAASSVALPQARNRSGLHLDTIADHFEVVGDGFAAALFPHLQIDSAFCAGITDDHIVNNPM